MSIITFNKTVFHTSVLIIYLFSFIYDFYFIKHGENETFLSGRSRLLTMWNVVLQIFFFSLCVIEDLQPQKSDKNLLHQFKNLVFSTLVLPMSIYIGLVFWCIYIINKNLIILHHIPLWLCHLCHTFTLFFALIELVTSRRKFPSQRIGVSMLTLFTGSYVVWIHIVYFWTGVWAYPFLKVFPLPLKILWNLGSVLGGIVFYFVGEKLNSLVWDSSVSKQL